MSHGIDRRTGEVVDRLVLCFCGYLILALASTSCAPSTPPEMPASASCAPAFEPDVSLVLAGSGSNLALIRDLHRRYLRAHGGKSAYIAQSIGTSGAVRALKDDTIHVGLASRPLRSGEKAAGIEETPLATTALVFATHQDNPLADLSTEEIIQIYRGERTRWDDQTPIVLLLREEGDSSASLVASWSPELGKAMETARKDARGLVLSTDQDMQRALSEVPGAIGFLDHGIVLLEEAPLRPLSLNGVAPGPVSLRSGAYPLKKTLTFLHKKGAREHDFVRFAHDQLRQGAYLSQGYTPAP